MQITRFKEDLKKMNAQELKEKLDSMRRELFGLKLNSTTAHVKDYSQFNKLKKNIARIASYLRQAQANT